VRARAHLALHSAHTAEYHNGAIQHAESPLDLDSEVHVT